MHVAATLRWVGAIGRRANKVLRQNHPWITILDHMERHVGLRPQGEVSARVTTPSMPLGSCDSLKSCKPCTPPPRPVAQANWAFGVLGGLQAIFHWPQPGRRKQPFNIRQQLSRFVDQFTRARHYYLGVDATFPNSMPLKVNGRENQVTLRLYRIKGLPDIGQSGLHDCTPLASRRERYRSLSRRRLDQGHVWTAPGWQEESSRCRVGRCSHVFGLLVRFT
jgi:hypothetical protein